MDEERPQPAVFFSSFALESSPMAGLDPEALRRLAAAAERRRLKRGEALIRRGELADSLYFLESGRLAVVEDNDEIVGEIAPGESVGEIGFFARVPRTFTVRAIRDSDVLTLTRENFDAVSREMPELRDSVIRALAVRLARLRPSPKPVAAPRTVAVAAAGDGRIPPRFLALLRKALETRGRALFLTRGDAARQLGGRPLEDPTTTGWLNALETGAEFVVYVADDGFTDWTRTCIRQADMLLLVAHADGAADLGETERFAFGLHAPTRRRLAILHEKRGLRASGTARWLAPRELFMHHHVSLQDGEDVARLARFLTGNAVGFVAGGGGALGAAHLGVYKAFLEQGAAFDMFGGASVGAAIAGALAMGLEVGEVDRAMHRIFVEQRAFRRFTFPYHSLLNHKAFDAALRAEFGECRIEDLWRPYFALSADLSDRGAVVHREGSLWRAVRASSAIPGALPPYFTADGRMLVDGGLIDNVPLAFMKALKGGPNLAVALSVDMPSLFAVDYDELPGPREWLARAVNPFGRRRTHGAPSILQVIVHSMLAGRRKALELGETDLLIYPTMPADIQWLQWRRHAEVFDAAYRGAVEALAAARAEGDARYAALLIAGRR